MKKGFTLVELSIVLVAVGLMIGGILIGQSLIHSAKINKIIKQLSEYDAAISNFRTKYKSIPGDSTKFGIAGSGDGDGIISSGELTYFWQHLSKGVGLKNKYGNPYPSFNPYVLQTTDIYCPTFDIEQDKTLTRCLYPSYDTNMLRWTYRYFEGLITAVPTYTPLKPIDVLAIDGKIDDGLALSGSVRNKRWGPEITPLCNSGNTYLTATNAFACTLIVEINRSNGDRW